MISDLKYKTKDGNKLRLQNVPVSMGIEMLFISCSTEEKRKVVQELTETLNKCN